MLVPASAGAGPTAKSAGEELLVYVTTGKLKAQKRIAYQIGCGANCSVLSTTTLKLKGPDLPPVFLSGQIPAPGVAEVFIELNRSARRALKDNIGAAKLVTEVAATNLTTGEVDADAVTFKFKR